MTSRERFINSVYTNAVWYIIGGLLLGYFSFRVLRPELTLEQMVRDVWAWVHTLFVVMINVVTVSAAYDSATQNGTKTSNFAKANELNNAIITEYNKEPQKFREFVKMLNEHERETMRQEFLFSHGVDSYEELTDKEKLEFDRLKPIYHDILGFNLALYYETTKGGKIIYNASEKQNEGKTKRMIFKGFQGVLIGVISVGVAFKSWGNIWEALLSLLIIGGGLLATYLTIYTPRFHKFSHELPNKVLHKNALWTSFVEKYDELKLKVLKMREPITSDLTNEKTETEQIHADSKETPTTD